MDKLVKSKNSIVMSLWSWIVITADGYGNIKTAMSPKRSTWP